MESTLPRPDFGIMADCIVTAAEHLERFCSTLPVVEDINRLVRSIDALTEQMAALRRETRQEFKTTQLDMAAFQEEFRAGVNALTGDIQRGFAEMGTEIQVSRPVLDGEVLHEGVPLRPV
ncbi:hypothetical protein E4U51_007340 [Claviceps purpurea]|nr:hypothetical protein E4U51_007340 [Claviceps purpurea]